MPNFYKLNRANATPLAETTKNLIASHNKTAVAADKSARNILSSETKIILKDKPSVEWPISKVTKHRLNAFNELKAKYVEKINGQEKQEIKLKISGEKFQDYQVTAIGGLFTALDGAKHISDEYRDQAVCAKLGLTLIDVRLPINLTGQTLKFCDLYKNEIETAYKCYWKTMQFITCHILERILPKDSLVIHMSSPWPGKSMNRASFASDIYVDCPSDEKWFEDVKVLQKADDEMASLIAKNHPSELIFADNKDCQDFFKYNKYKQTQILSMITDKSEIPLYKFGDQIDMSFGPLLPRLGLIGRTRFTKIHQLDQYGANSKVFRLQGVSVPSSDKISDEAFEFLAKSGARLNTACHITVEGDNVNVKTRDLKKFGSQYSKFQKKTSATAVSASKKSEDESKEKTSSSKKYPYFKKFTNYKKKASGAK